jgi:hydrogenase maturation factor HypE
MTVEQRLDTIDAQLSQLVIASAQLLESVMTQTHQIEIQTDQIGRLTEGLIEIRLIGERQERNIARLLDVTERQLCMIERLIPRLESE